MFRHALLMGVLCVSVCRKTVFVYLTTRGMKCRDSKGEGGEKKKKRKNNVPL